MRSSSRPNDLGEFRVLAFLRQQLNERLDGDHAVFDFVRHARRERAEAGQPVEPSEVLLKTGVEVRLFKTTTISIGSRGFTGKMLARNAVAWPKGISRFKIALPLLAVP